ncbi:hypothetical protein GCM10027195_26330 [Comamonas sediminis]
MNTAAPIWLPAFGVISSQPLPALSLSAPTAVDGVGDAVSLAEPNKDHAAAWSLLNGSETNVCAFDAVPKTKSADTAMDFEIGVMTWPESLMDFVWKCNFKFSSRPFLLSIA